MNRRQMLMASLPLVAAPSLVFAQSKAQPAAVTTKAEPKRDPYAPTEVSIRNDFEVGSIVVVSKDFFLYHVVAPGRAIRYGVAVGKNELVWKGRATVGRKTEWPSWTPTPAMIKRNPGQYAKWADGMPGGPATRWARGRCIFTMPRATTPRSASTARPSRIRSAALSRTAASACATRR